ncbi:hypothetical protein H310_05944 [Aphanomyces invadans]|uniref:Uncharacterized protein n=1 Tax=Aphanomyces invadans TaxID=157072 RepID=A0A024U7P6_9STRA|nr:hypothetical protein H310_05944 [Aphanomyces invadans]ETW02431.1 hypothetical protein H310_05944 [Aphanomyces invadans]|eukprot:XP_008869036.1 hypothetical protein H310_05944 [Aphanomyces invadans]
MESDEGDDLVALLNSGWEQPLGRPEREPTQLRTRDPFLLGILREDEANAGTPHLHSLTTRRPWICVDAADEVTPPMTKSNRKNRKGFDTPDVPRGPRALSSSITPSSHHLDEVDALRRQLKDTTDELKIWKQHCATTCHVRAPRTNRSASSSHNTSVSARQDKRAVSELQEALGHLQTRHARLRTSHAQLRQRCKELETLTASQTAASAIQEQTIAYLQEKLQAQTSHGLSRSKGTSSPQVDCTGAVHCQVDSNPPARAQDLRSKARGFGHATSTLKPALHWTKQSDFSPIPSLHSKPIAPPITEKLRQLYQKRKNAAASLSSPSA